MITLERRYLEGKQCWKPDVNITYCTETKKQDCGSIHSEPAMGKRNLDLLPPARRLFVMYSLWLSGKFCCHNSVVHPKFSPDV